MGLFGQRTPATLVLEDGSVFHGYAFASSGEVMGEVVFNTGMSGYQEILTDPSYKGQILTMTYPLIGNYGANDEDMESDSIHMEGFIIKEYQPYPSNWRSKYSLRQFLGAHDTLGVEGIDTRALTRKIRTAGAMRAILSTETDNVNTLMKRLETYPGLVGQDLVRLVSCRKPYVWKNGKPMDLVSRKSLDLSHPLVVVIDCGVKYSILRNLEAMGFSVLVVPSKTTAAEILSYRPDGVLLSNGPGDPAPLTYVIETTRELLGKLPVFGICLGHQILGQALGARTAKLKFGHHGINQPVKNLDTSHIDITSQNHGFIVETGTLPADVREAFINLNDGTSEGIYYPSLKAFSVQYHPEAAPGPHDARYLFKEFLDLVRQTSSQGME